VNNKVFTVAAKHHLFLSACIRDAPDKIFLAATSRLHLVLCDTKRHIAFAQAADRQSFSFSGTHPFNAALWFKFLGTQNDAIHFVFW